MEWDAEYYSVKMFYTVWPEKLKYLKEILKTNLVPRERLVDSRYRLNPQCRAIFDIIKENK